MTYPLIEQIKNNLKKSNCIPRHSMVVQVLNTCQYSKRVRGLLVRIPGLPNLSDQWCKFIFSSHGLVTLIHAAISQRWVCWSSNILLFRTGYIKSQQWSCSLPSGINAAWIWKTNRNPNSRHNMKLKMFSSPRQFQTLLQRDFIFNFSSDIWSTAKSWPSIRVWT